MTQPLSTTERNVNELRNTTFENSAPSLRPFLNDGTGGAVPADGDKHAMPLTVSEHHMTSWDGVELFYRSWTPVSGKTDVVIGSTSDTLERAKTVGFTYPYFVFKFQVIAHEDKNIDSFEDLKNLKVGAALGTTYETEYLAYAEQQGWGKDNYTSFKSENDAYLGLYQGKVDAIISTNTNIATKLRSEEFEDFEAGPYVPNYDDVVGIIAKRDEVAWINYLNLFLVRQIRDGNMNEAYNKHFGTDAPADLIQSLRDNK